MAEYLYLSNEQVYIEFNVIEFGTLLDYVNRLISVAVYTLREKGAKLDLSLSVEWHHQKVHISMYVSLPQKGVCTFKVLD